jgi:acetyl-CoA C-acetyltransferase
MLLPWLPIGSLAGEASVAIAGGIETISLVQFNRNMNGIVYEPLQQRMPAVWWTMIQTADFVAKKYGIGREAQDAYVVDSQKRVAAATAGSKFTAEIVPFTTTMKVTDKATKESHAQEVTLDRDEGPRSDTTIAGLARLKPVYLGGTITAGNASQLSDGAAAAVMMDADLAARRGLPILGRFRGMQLAAVAPRR